MVLIHGGGSTLQTSFGNLIPVLSKHRQVIAVDLQAHGRTNDRNAELTFEQDAYDVVKLLQNLNIHKAAILGFSNGSHTAMEIAFRHPGAVTKLILCSTFYKRSGVFSKIWEGFDHAKLSDMPEILREGFLKVNNDTVALQNMFDRDVQRMKKFKDWSDDQLRSIKFPTLIINGNTDVGSTEHAVEMYRLIPNCELAIFPGGHGTYIGTIESLENGVWPKFNAVTLIEEFLDKE